MRKIYALIAMSVSLLTGCTNEEDLINGGVSLDHQKRIEVVAEDFIQNEVTRAAYDGYHFKWTDGDALGIFPQNGRQTAFPINKESVGSNTAMFDGGKWALKPNSSYAAYFPLVEDMTIDKTNIPISYIGQTQTGNATTTHLSKYDFMASSFSNVDENGNVSFQMKHLGCLVQFKLTMPKADEYCLLRIESDNERFITEGFVDLTSDETAIKATSTSKYQYLNLQDISTTEENQVLTINMMIAPVDLSNSNLKVSVYGKDGTRYTSTIEGRDLPKGYAYGNTAGSTDSGIPYITFEADEEQTFGIYYGEYGIEDFYIQYSVNDEDWKTLILSDYNNYKGITFGGNYGKLKLRAKNPHGTYYSGSVPISGGRSFKYGIEFFFSGVTKVRCTGDIRTLVDYENYLTADTRSANFTDLFAGCSQLISAPELPSKELGYGGYFTRSEGCYSRMFAGCTSLTTAPELPATNLETSCYSGMFEGCTSLTEAPVLPATELTVYCYENMFAGCTSLTTAPELPATNLKTSCYSGMFAGCTNLSYIKMMGCERNNYGTIYPSIEGCVDNWIDGVSASGTFIKSANATWDEEGIVPEGWTVKTATE